LVVALVTNYLARKREREADWRRLQLERYRELVAAVSGVEKARSTPAEHRRYADAINEIQLVASPEVLGLLQRFLDHNASGRTDWSQERHDDLYHQLIAAMRRDLRPQDKGGDAGPGFWLQAIPKSAAASAPAAGRHAGRTAPRPLGPDTTSGS